MKYLFIFILSLFALQLGHNVAMAQKLEVPERGFVSTSQGETWEEGLLSGNGTIGANIFSQPEKETIIFTHERLFLPKGDPYMPPEATGKRLFEIRTLIEKGLYAKATELAADLSGQPGFMYHDPFVPAFDMRIETEKEGQIEDYARSVDFQTGEATVHWADDRGVFERKMFVSRADSVAVLLMTAPGRGDLNCRITLEPRKPSGKLGAGKLQSSYQSYNNNVSDVEQQAKDQSLIFTNKFPNAYPGSIHGLEGVARIMVKNGTATPSGNSMVVKGADQVMVLLDINLIYKEDHSEIEQTQKRLANLSQDYGQLLQPHAQIHGELFNRMRLDLGGNQHDETSETLLASSTNEKLNMTLVEKLFDAARYNIISSTGELPPTLQGIWAGTYTPNWASDFTHNGNVPSAIASYLMGNMPELMTSYTSYIESIVPYMEINAEHMFGARGIVLPSRSTTTGFNNAMNPRFAGGFWVAGAPWAAHFFYDYYLYTGDKAFLKEHALPFMEKTALFFEDYLYEGPDGNYVFNPTQSPENTPANTNSQGTYNATMAVASTKELLINLIEASQELGVNGEKIPQWQDMLDKMPPYMINEKGAIKEWLTPELKNNDNHRHASHLYPLYDDIPEEIANSPKLQEAFKRSIEIKYDRHWTGNRTGFMSFGLVQLGQATTGLGESEMAYECLKQLVNHYWLSNLASMHNYKSLLNMDISGGMPAVIIKMLAYSDPGTISLLPALPAEWESGAIKGILCRGQVEIESLEWDGNDVEVKLVSDKKQQVTIELPSEITDFSIESAQGKVAGSSGEKARIIELPQSEEVILNISMK